MAFVMDLVEAAQGEKVTFFRSCKNKTEEIKIYFTDTKIILAKFQARNYIGMESRFRGSRESLLGFEGMVTELLLKNSAQNNLLSPRHH